MERLLVRRRGRRGSGERLCAVWPWSSASSFASPPLSITRSRRVLSVHDSEESTLYDDTHLARNDALPANYAKPLAQRKPSPSKQKSEPTDLEEPLDTIST